MKPTSVSSSRSSTSLKLKSTVQIFIFSHVSNARSYLLYFFREIHLKLKHIMKKKKNSLFLDSFRLHCNNWCFSSSHVNILRQESYYNYCDPSWDYVINDPAPNALLTSPSSCDVNYHALQEEPDELLRYLEWLDQEKEGKIVNSVGADRHDDEIDKLADAFIANCHDRFRSEKEDSYRRFQEMIARSI